MDAIRAREGDRRPGTGSVVVFSRYERHIDQAFWLEWTDLVVKMFLRVVAEVTAQEGNVSMEVYDAHDGDARGVKAEGRAGRCVGFLSFRRSVGVVV